MSYKPNNLSVTAGRDGSRTFKGDHDDRWVGNVNRGYRRGGREIFRGNRRGGRFRHFNPDSSRFRNRPGGSHEDEDGDFSMGGGDAMNKLNRDRNQLRNIHRGRYNSNRRSSQGHSGPSSRTYKTADAWFKVMVPFGATLNREDLFGLISSNIQDPLEAVSYSTDERRAYFFIKGNALAESLRTLSRRVTKPDGHKLILHVSPSQAPPEHAIDENTLEKLKLRMSDRYDPSTQLLNLSAFYMDEGLQKENIFLPLNRVSTMVAVTKIISEHIPELSGLDVSKNKILSVGHMSDLVKATPNVVSLNIGGNQIRNLDELDKLKGWSNIVELVLDGNDLCNNYSNQSAYIR